MRIPSIDPSCSPFSEHQAAEINALFSSLGPQQTAWLLGFFSATNQLQREHGNAPAPVNGRPGLTVLFASQTGNAAKVAGQLVTAATSAGIRCVPVNVADYKTTSLHSEHNLVLIASTQGEGDPPDSAAELHRFLFGKRAPRLEGLRFAVLALGDESYDHFCKAGADFDRRFEELGGERMLPRVDCDVDYQLAAEAWQVQVIERFKHLSEAARTLVEVPAAVLPVTAASFDKDHPFAAPVLERIHLNGRGSEKQTVHIELSLAGSSMQYRPGDTLGVLPRNSPGYVEELLAAAHLPAEASVSVDGQELPLARALIESFEVTTVTRSFAKAYGAATGHQELTALLEEGRQDAFRAYCHGREMIDVLQAYPPSGLDPQAFVGMLRRLQPRHYSITSSLLVHPDEAHLLVGLTHYQAHGRVRKGVCSGYLCERLSDDEPVRIYPSPNPGFKLPAHPDTRVIMIGPGTGIAPFRAFLEEREASGCRGPNWLFFGDRSFATDFSYQVEWQRWRRSGLLSRVDLAFSRDQREKIYVQHRMRQASRDLYAWLEDGAHLYVCGDASRMANAVHETLLDIVGTEGGKDHEAAIAYVDALRSDRRYQRDVY